MSGFTLGPRHSTLRSGSTPFGVSLGFTLKLAQVRGLINNFFTSLEDFVMKRFLLAFLISAAALPFQESPSSAAPPVRDAPATSTLNDFFGSQLNRIGNDSLGPYLNGTNSVSSIVQGIGNWVLDTKPSSVRRVRIDLGDPVIGSGANPPFQAASVPVRFISKCTTNITTLAAGQSISCPLALSIDYGGATYALRTNDNYQDTEPVTWTCLARNSTKCVSWTMVPSAIQADGERKVAMQLLKPASKRVPEQLLGRFYMSFDISVTTP